MVDTTNTWHSLELWPNLLSLIRIGSSWFTSSPRSFEYLPSEFGRPSGPWPNFKLGVLGMFTGAFGCLNTSMVEWWTFKIRFEFNNKNPKRRDSWRLLLNCKDCRKSPLNSIFISSASHHDSMSIDFYDAGHVVSTEATFALASDGYFLVTWTLITFDHMSR